MFVHTRIHICTHTCTEMYIHICTGSNSLVYDRPLVDPMMAWFTDAYILYRWAKIVSSHVMHIARLQCVTWACHVLLCCGQIVKGIKNRTLSVYCGDHSHVWLCLGIRTLCTSRKRVHWRSQGTTLSASYLYNAGATILNPFHDMGYRKIKEITQKKMWIGADIACINLTYNIVCSALFSNVYYAQSIVQIQYTPERRHLRSPPSF